MQKIKNLTSYFMASLMIFCNFLIPLGKIHALDDITVSLNVTDKSNYTLSTDNKTISYSNNDFSCDFGIHMDKDSTQAVIFTEEDTKFTATLSNDENAYVYFTGSQTGGSVFFSDTALEFNSNYSVHSLKALNGGVTSESYNLAITEGNSEATDNIQIDFKATNTDKGVGVIFEKEPLSSDIFVKEMSTTVKGTADATKVNNIYIQAYLGEKIEKITINGTIYEGDTLENHLFEDTSGIKSYKFTLAGTEKYIIEAVCSEDENAPAVIIWANGAEDIEDIFKPYALEHGKAKIVKVLDSNDKELDLSTLVKQDSSMGTATIPVGSTVVFEISPNRGYQLTSLLIGEKELSAQSEVNQFAYSVEKGGEIKFDAKFTPVEDQVVSHSSKISSGSIAVAESDINSGLAQLTVEDLSNSSALSQENYKIFAGLDLSLQEVTYKAKDDVNDVWKEEKKELSTPAEISFVLSEIPEGNEIVMIHEKSDGNFEIIPTNYNKENKMITFQTSSFSNYAIASKISSENSVSKENGSNPKTGDNILWYAVIFAATLVGIYVVFKIRKSKVNS